MPHRLPTSGIPTPSVRKSSGAQPAAQPKGEAAAKIYRQQISPSGMASAKAAQNKALDKKYPGMYTTPKPTAKPSNGPSKIKVIGGGIIAIPNKPKPGTYKN